MRTTDILDLAEQLKTQLTGDIPAEQKALAETSIDCLAGLVCRLLLIEGRLDRIASGVEELVANQ